MIRIAFYCTLASFLLLTGCDNNSQKNKAKAKVAAVAKQSVENKAPEPKAAKPDATKAQESAASSGSDSNKNSFQTFDAASLKAFETCTITDDLLKTREYLIKNSKPAQSFEGYLTYKIKADFSGLPIKQVIFGVCLKDEPLLKDCSFVEDIALVLDVDYDKAKATLQKQKGIDFSVVKRDDSNEGSTERPVLYKGVDGSTVLHCDTGGL